MKGSVSIKNNKINDVKKFSEDPESDQKRRKLIKILLNELMEWNLNSIGYSRIHIFVGYLKGI